VRTRSFNAHQPHLAVRFLIDANLPRAAIDVCRKCGHQRINSGTSQLGKCCLATIDPLHCCLHGVIASACHFAGFSTWTLGLLAYKTAGEVGHVFETNASIFGPIASASVPRRAHPNA
jgi:hypothetical protein